MSIFIALSIVVLLLALLLSGKTYLYDYHIADEEIIVKILNMVTIFRIDYDNVLEARVCPWWKIWLMGFIPLVLKNRLAKKFVAIRLESGIFRFVVLTPTDPDDFARTVNEKIRLRQH